MCHATVWPSPGVGKMHSDHERLCMSRRATKLGGGNQAHGFSLADLWACGSLKCLWKWQCRCLTSSLHLPTCQEGIVSPSVRWWVGREPCWTPSWLLRATGKDLGYSTCCRGVFGKSLQDAKWVNFSDATGTGYAPVSNTRASCEDWEKESLDLVVSI